MKEETVFTLENIWHAYKTCIKNKKKTINRLKFELKREREIIKIRDELLNKKYKISRHVYFIVTEPKPREVFAADFRDRIVHHLVYNELALLCENWFISNSYANRPGKGTHAGFKKVRDFVKQNKKAWYLKLDIFSFFKSIDKTILFKIIVDFIEEQDKPSWWKRDMSWICRKIIFDDSTKNFIFKGELRFQKLIPKEKSLFFSGGNGLPIGNLTSQFFANCYLDGMDKYITEKLGFYKYVRYVDDFIVIYKDKEKLKRVVSIIDEWLLVERKISIHPKKIIIQKVTSGIDFVGYIIKPTHTLVRQKVVKRFKNKLFQFRNNEDGLFSVSDIPMIKSYLGHFGHANSFNLVSKLNR